MEKLLIDLGPQSYYIYINGDLNITLGKYLKEGEKGVIITDDKLVSLYENKLREFSKGRKLQQIIIPQGEGSKNLRQVEAILKQMLELGLNRKSKLVAFGGGVVGDIAGFCASIYMRGLPFIQIPTSLLAQVDSSVGGKTGVNFGGGKNMVGSFYQPQAVLIDSNSLKTLDRRELISGIGEVIKYGVIYDYDFLDFIGDNLGKILNLDESILKIVIKRCCEIKAEIVSRDERETGLRKILNFGHTLGHGIESVSSYKKYNHGEAVIIGMYYESLMANKLAYIKDDYCNKILSILRKTGIFLDIKELPLQNLLTSMTRDKKNQGGDISFILPRGRGKVKEKLLSPEEAGKILKAI